MNDVSQQDTESTALEAHRGYGYHQTMLNLSGNRHPHVSMADRFEATIERLRDLPGYPSQEDCDHAEAYGETMAQNECRQQQGRPAFGRG